jgi:hypothetical protein
MNRKSTRNNQRAPTSQPANSIAPSATLAMDGDLPVSASNGVSAPEPLASHDVLHAALAPLPGDAGAVSAAVSAEPEGPAVSGQKSSSKKSAKKPVKSVAEANDDTAAAPDAAPAKPIKVPKIKFVEITFALPESEAELLDAMKKTHQANGLALKKGQLLRAGLLALADIDAERLAQLVAHLPVEPRASKKKK